MKIAFIVEAFPVLSQTFVLNQVTGLIDRGHEVDIYAEFNENITKVHPDVEKYDLLSRTFYHPQVPQNKFRRLLKGVWLFLTNFPIAPLLLLRSLNVFKYKKDATSLRLLYSVIPLVKRRPVYDVIQCHFGLLGIKGMLLRDIGALQGKHTTAFHGVDISQNL
jgi:colanic acid/amylovoran biosynthesis glycosyltransferase